VHFDDERARARFELIGGTSMTTHRTRPIGARARRSLGLAAVVVLGLGLSLGACEPKEPGTGSAALMPDVRCLDLQAAQDRAQEAGIPTSSSRDASGHERKQVWDRNWVVVEQTPAPGTAVGGAEVVFSVLKDDEPSTCTPPATTVRPTSTAPATAPTTTALPTPTTTVPAPATTGANPMRPGAPPIPTTARPAPPPPAATPTCANGSYVNADGNAVCRPQSGPVAPPGATARCKDGTWSSSQNRRGTCSSHGGVAEWL
jgi:hypothetical protein